MPIDLKKVCEQLFTDSNAAQAFRNSEKLALEAAKGSADARSALVR